MLFWWMNEFFSFTSFIDNLNILHFHFLQQEKLLSEGKGKC